MRFQVVPLKAASKDPVNNSINLPNVRAALKHELTETGKMTLKRVIKKPDIKIWSLEIEVWGLFHQLYLCVKSSVQAKQNFIGMS